MGRSLEGSVVLVTGASAGIGAALVQEAVGRGARVVAVARRQERLEQVAAAFGGRVLPVVADVRVDGELERAVAGGLERFGRLDVAVANAGFGVAGLLEELTLEDIRRQFETNVFGVVRTLYATLPALVASRGTFAIVGSVMGYVSVGGSVPYSMSKFAVRALAEGLRCELRPHGVAVVLVSPGFVESDIRRTDRWGVVHEHARDTVPPWLRMPTGVAARKIVRAIVQRRREVILTTHGRIAVFLARHLPRTTAFLLARARPRRRSGKEAGGPAASRPEGQLRAR
jgi:NAD(P)-dependent dehydrogenase (short-subunit alcohol dehydrogenase family)